MISNAVSSRIVRTAGWIPLILAGAVCSWFSLTDVAAAQSGRGVRELRDDRPAQSSRAVPERSVVGAAVESGLLERWQRRKALLGRGGPAAAEKAGEELLQFLRDEGYRRHPELADALILEGRAARDAGDLAAARDAFMLARAFDPDSASAWWLEARTRFSSGDGIGTFSGLAFKAIGASFNGFWRRYSLIVGGSFLAWCALLLAAIVTLVCLVIREAPVIAHAIDEMLPARWHPAWRTTIGWSLVAAPAACIFLGAWSLAVWAVLLIAFTGGRTRNAAVACLVVIALAVPALGTIGAAAEVAASPEARVAIDGAERVYRPGNLEALAELRRAEPDRALWGHLEARMLGLRDPNRTVSLLRSAIESDPREPRFRIQLGNIFYGLDKFEPASAAYREALELDSENVTALYNLAKARLAILDFDGHEEMMGRAHAADAKRLDLLQNEFGDDRVATVHIGVGEVARGVVLGSFATAMSASVHIINPITAVAMAALLAAAAVRFRREGGVPHLCEGCGQAICSRCTPSSDHDAALLCVACCHLLSHEAGLAPSARAEQAQKIDAHIRGVGRGRRLVHWLWPGPALIHEGRLFTGIVLTLVWLALWSAALDVAAFLPSSRVVESSLWGGLTWGLMGLCWVVAQTSRLAPRPLSRPRVG